MTPPRPRVLLLEITRRCHRRCRHCAVEGQPGAAPDALDGLAPDVVEQAAALGVERLDLTGGEPLLSPAFWASLEAARRAGVRVGTCATTGDLLDDGALDRMVSLLGVLPVFSISLDGATPDVADVLRGRGAHAGATRAIEVIGRRAGEVWIVTLLHAGNAQRLDELLAWITARPWIRKWKVALVRAAGRARSFASAPVDVTAVLSALAQRIHEDTPNLRVKIADFFKYNGLYQRVEYRPSGHPCEYLRGVVTVTSAADVVSCPPGGDSGHPGFRFGNLGRKSLAQILDGPDWRAFWAWSIGDIAACRGCALLAACGGGCRANAVLQGCGLDGCDALARAGVERLLAQPRVVSPGDAVTP